MSLYGKRRWSGIRSGRDIILDAIAVGSQLAPFRKKPKRVGPPSGTPSGQSNRVGNSYTSVDTDKKKRRKRRKSSSGYLAGKRRYKRLAKKRFSKQAHYQTAGTVITTEYGSTATASECLYIGHTSTSINSIIYSTGMTIIKKLFAMKGFQVSNVEEPLSGTYKVSFSYVSNPLGGAPAQVDSATIDITTLAASGNQLGSAIWDLFCSVPTASAGSYPMLTKATLFEETAAGTDSVMSMIDLRNYKIMIWGKSHLKIQNQTVNTEENVESSDVNNCPVNGKIYAGKGQGLIPKNFVSDAFVGSSIVGLIAADASNVDTTHNLREPPVPQQFMNVIKCDKIRINPGGIKTTIVTSENTYNISKLFEVLYSTSGKRLFGPGKFIVSALEKTIDYNNQNITVAFEVQDTVGTKLVAAGRNYTGQWFRKQGP